MEVLKFGRRVSSVAPVGAGVALVGFAAYGVLGLAGHSLTPRDYAAFASLYLLTTIVGTGVFSALEQETNREVSSRVAVDIGTRPVVRTASIVSAATFSLVAVLIVGASPYLVERVFAGSWTLLWATVLAVLGAAASSVLRGFFAGQRRYNWYAAATAAEGLGRLLPCGLLILLAPSSVGAFGMVFALGTIVATVTGFVGFRGGGAGPELRVRTMSGRVGYLVGSAGLTYLVANLAPVVVTARSTTDATLAASFATVFLLTRIPLFLFAPMQAFLVPAATGAVSRGDTERVRLQVRIMLSTVAVLGTAGIAGGALFGPWAARVLFAAPSDLPAGVFALLGAATMAMMAAQVLGPALIAFGLHGWTTSAWLTGTVCFLGLLFMPSPLEAAVLAQVVGPVLVMAIMLVRLRRAVRELRDSQWVSAAPGRTADKPLRVSEFDVEHPDRVDG